MCLGKDIAEAAAPHARYSPRSDTIRPSQPGWQGWQGWQGWMVTTIGLPVLQNHVPLLAACPVDFGPLRGDLAGDLDHSTALARDRDRCECGPDGRLAG